MQLFWKRLAPQLYFSLILLLIASGCSIDSAVQQLRTPNFKVMSHDVAELSTDLVFVELLGQCPVGTSAVEIALNNQKATKVTNVLSVASGQVGDFQASCDASGKLTIRYYIPNPDEERELNFVVLTRTENAVSDPVVYSLDYIRPQLPKPVLTSYTSNQIFTNLPSPTLSGVCIPNRITGLEFKLDNGTWTSLACSGTGGSGTWVLPAQTFTGNPETNYVIEMRAVSTASTPTRYSENLVINITADFIAPTTAPTNLGVKNNPLGATTTWVSADFPLVSWDVVADFNDIELTIKNQDGSQTICGPLFVPNSGSYQVQESDCSQALLDGESYQIIARGRDTAGNISTTEGNTVITVDRTAPTLAWSQTPTSPSATNFFEFAWTASAGTGAPLSGTFECLLDSGAWQTCTSPYLVENLSSGNHQLQVRTSDEAGNGVTISHLWDVALEQDKPSCTMTTPDIYWTDNDAEVQFTCSDNLAVRKVECRLDGAAWSICTSATSYFFSGLSHGNHTVEVRALDEAGNYSDLLTEYFRADVLAPVITFTVTPPSETSANSASFSFLVLDPDSGTSTIECSLDGGAYSSCTTPHAVTGPLSEGAHSLSVRATDTVGNTSTPVTYNWTVDFTGPQAPVFGPDEDGPKRPTWTWTTGGGGNGTYRIKLNDNDLLSGTTETTTTSYTPATDLSFGTHILYAQERDEAGNWSSTGFKRFFIKCGQGEYFDSGNCLACPAGTYQDEFALEPTCKANPIGTFSNLPGAASPTVCPWNSTTIGTGATSLSDCLGNGGFFNCEDGICNPAGMNYFSPNNSNTRTACPANSYSGVSGADADAIDDCRAGVDYWDDDSNPSTAPVVVGVGNYSPNRDNARYMCTNKPPNATVVLYSDSGAGTNNCPVSAVVDCSPGFIPMGTTCFDNSPWAITFANQSNLERNTVVESNAVTVEGFDGPLEATCSGCSAIARNGVWGGTTVTGFMPGDTIALRTTTSNSFTTQVIVNVTLGSTTSSNWLLGTRAAYDCNDPNIGLVAHGASANAYSEATPLPSVSCASIRETRTCFDGTLSGTLTHPTCSEGCGATIFGDLRTGQSGTAYSSATPAGTCASVAQTRTCNNGVLSGSFTNTTCSNACSAGDFVNVPHGQSRTAYSTNSILSGSCTTYQETRTCNNGSFSGSFPYATCSYAYIIASGGSVSDVNIGGKMYRIHTFNSSGTFSVSSIGSLSGNVTYLVVAGGGGGGGGRYVDTANGGGGGGGGVLEGTLTLPSTGNFTVTVGGGGAGGGDHQQGGNGGNSAFHTVTAIGGGGGGRYGLPGSSGGSGGGGGAGGAPSGGAGTAGQGFAGGSGAGPNVSEGVSGGGGGAGGAGGAATGAYGPSGNGGNGKYTTITGAGAYYGGGGGGGRFYDTGGGSGGLGGGGIGGVSYAPKTTAGHGGANTGGGGGGGSAYDGVNGGGAWNSPGGNGGSGRVIIRYPLEP